MWCFFFWRGGHWCRLLKKLFFSQFFQVLFFFNFFNFFNFFCFFSICFQFFVFFYFSHFFHSLGVCLLQPKPKLLSPDIFRWGGGLPREGVGAKKFGTSLETQESNFFGGISRHFAGISRKRPKSLRNKCLGSILVPYKIKKSQPMATQHGVQILPERNTLLQAIHMREVHASTPNSLKCIGTTQGKISTTCHDNRLAIDRLPATKITRIPPPSAWKKTRRHDNSSVFASQKKTFLWLFLFSTPAPNLLQDSKSRSQSELTPTRTLTNSGAARMSASRTYHGMHAAWREPWCGLSARGLRKHVSKLIRKAAAGQTLHAHGRIQKVDWLHAHQNYNEPIVVSMAAFQLRTLYQLEGLAQEGSLACQLFQHFCWNPGARNAHDLFALLWRERLAVSAPEHANPKVAGRASLILTREDGEPQLPCRHLPCPVVDLGAMSICTHACRHAWKHCTHASMNARMSYLSAWHARASKL